MKTCTVTGCGRKHKGRGLCDMHLQRLRRTGTTASPIRSLAERFWDKVDRRGPDECWPWTGATKEGGYGVMRPEGRRSGPTVKAHRVSAQLAGMDIEGRVVRHRCDNPPCVNPAHLEPGDQQQNVDDMVERGRQARGSRRSNVLTERDVERIHEMRAAGMLMREIAAELSCSRPTVSLILSGKTWTHVTPPTPPAARDLIAAVAESLGGAA